MHARSLVLWLPDHAPVLLEEPGRDIAGTVAMRLANAGRNTRALRTARKQLGMGVALDTEAWRNQCRPDHLLRRQAFRDLGYDARDLFAAPRVEIERPFSSTEVRAYARAHLDAQLRYDPTVLQCPGHIYASEVGLRNDLALAEATAELVTDRALREPSDVDAYQLRRSLYATICVRCNELTRERIRVLVDHYVRLRVDGFWLWAVGFEPSGAQGEALLRLALALQENSGKPACPGGLGNLWQAALARGVAAAVAGPARGAVAVDFEEPPPKPRDPKAKDEGRRIHTYHGVLLGHFAFGDAGDAVRDRTFLRNPCGCGHHERGTPPEKYAEVHAHNQYWRLKEARWACRGTSAEAVATLGVRLPGVRAERAAVGLATGLPVAWQRSVEDWDQLPVGWGAAEGRAG